jgi:class 3 adenylate cyclase
MASTRRLAAILAADVAGYSRLMGAARARLSSDVSEIKLIFSIPPHPW